MHSGHNFLLGWFYLSVRVAAQAAPEFREVNYNIVANAYLSCLVRAHDSLV